jgi:hypothetical protein
MHFTTALLTLAGFGLNITPVHSAAVPTLDLSRRAEEPINSGDHSDMAERRHFYFPGQNEAVEKRHFYFPGQDEATEKKRHFYFPGQDEATEKKRHFYFPGQDEAAEK